MAKGQIPNQYDTQLFIYDLASRKTQAITRDFNPSVEEAVWHEDGNIYAKVTDADFVRLYRYRNGKFSRIDCPGDMILQTTWAQHAPAMMYTASTVHYPAQVYTLDLTDDKAILWDNPCQKQFRDVEFGEMKDWDYNYKKALSSTGGTICRQTSILPKIPSDCVLLRRHNPRIPHIRRQMAFQPLHGERLCGLCPATVGSHRLRTGIFRPPPKQQWCKITDR